jgi:hypothetical protein
MPGGEKDVPEAVAVELEAALDRPHAIDAAQDEALVPAAPLAQPLDVGEELLDRRVVAVGDGLEQRSQRAPPRHTPEGEAGEGAREAVAVALGAHLPLPDRRGAHPPRRRGVGVRPEDRDLAGREGPAQGLVRGEARESGAHDRDARHYFTEPASSPCTK